MRKAFIWGSVLAAAMVLSAAPVLAAPHQAPAGKAVASAAPAALAGNRAAAIFGPGLRESARQAVPAALKAGSHTDALDGDSCYLVVSPDDPNTHFGCYAVGYFFDLLPAGSEGSLGEQWNQGASAWGFAGPTDVLRNITLPYQVSCVTPDGAANTCMLVGQHFRRSPRYAAQLAEVESGFSEFSIISLKNPAGSTWSSLNDVSCATDTFCVTVGQAGTSTKTARGVTYYSHGTAYTWNGSSSSTAGRLVPLHPPAPAGARYSELTGLSCASTTTCMAVGNYISPARKWRTYAALWNNGTWQLQSTPSAASETNTRFEGVACPTVTLCMAVGDAYRPGSRPFAALWSGGTWAMSSTAAASRAGFASDTCASASDCVATGWEGVKGLIEAWNGSTWAVQPAPVPHAPFNADVLLHVSCVAGQPTECTAVGYEYNPKIALNRRLDRTLAMVWDGTSWQVQKTINY
jgi:hypothetical protein